MPQSLAKLYVHAVFSTKNREPLLLEPWREDLFQVLGGIVNNIGCPSLLVGGVADHVHMLFRLSRTITLADAMNRLKTNASAWVNRLHANGSFRWQHGYGAFSVGRSEVEVVREYIRRQPEHHSGETFQEELRRWFQDYEIEWDEKYVWD
ncbi:MAG: IS200/IS605 family transposase [Fimbriiglobus sp.]|nr:IS200/IS605 family transposase [Fimbriiglobus sp.]